MRLGFLSRQADNESDCRSDSAPAARFEPQLQAEPPPPPRLPAPPLPEGASLTATIKAAAAARKEVSVNEALLQRIAAFREQVAADLYDRSSDYQILCHLTHSDLRSSEALLNELRHRLSADASYLVLAKLDEAYALVERRVPAPASQAA